MLRLRQEQRGEVQRRVSRELQLQRALDRFAAYYNEVRPHREIGRRTPMSLYSAREKAGPSASFVKVGDRRLRLDKVDTRGRVTLCHRGRLHHIGIGNPYAGWRVAMLIDGLDVEIVGLDGSPLHRLVLDPTKDYQRSLIKAVYDVLTHLGLRCLATSHTRRRRDSNPGKRLCRPLPEPLGHAAKLGLCQREGNPTARASPERQIRPPVRQHCGMRQFEGPLIGGHSAGYQSPCGSVVCPTSMM
jgi:Integrase core domain